MTSTPPHPHNIFVEKKLDQVFYHIVSWMQDEGDYQPTEKEAQEKVRAIILAAVEHGEEDLINKCKSAYQHGKNEGRREMREEIRKSAALFDNAQAEIRGVPFKKIYIIAQSALTDL